MWKMCIKPRRKALAVLVILALLGGVAPSSLGQTGSNPTQEDYEDVVERLDEARQMVEQMERRERVLREDISTTDARRRALEIEVEELTALVEDAQARLNAAEDALERIQADLDEKTEELQQTLAELEAAHEEMQSRAVRVYKSGPSSFLEFVFGAEDFRDLVTRAHLLVRVFRGDQERILWIRDTKARVEAERDEVAALREQAAEQVARVRGERDRVAEVQQNVEARRSRLASELHAQYAQLENTRAERERWLREQQELEQQSRAIAALLRGRTGGQASAAPGEMVWPTSGPVTSGYGWRTHPIFGTRRFHAGIDIGAPTGRPVVAAATGTVASTGWRGGYGQTVIVDHGGGLATLYAHLSSIGVGEGQLLAQGEFLGRVGCTGSCTGPHLHFEVRVNGEPQNPMGWLP